MHTLTTGYTDTRRSVTIHDAASEVAEIVVSVSKHGADDYRVSFDSILFATDELAAEFAASFAKARKAGTGHLSTSWSEYPLQDRSQWGGKTTQYLIPTVMIASVALISNGTTGGKNETAAKRLRALLADLAKRGIAVREHSPFTNSATLADALAAN